MLGSKRQSISLSKVVTVLHRSFIKRWIPVGEKCFARCIQLSLRVLLLLMTKNPDRANSLPQRDRLRRMIEAGAAAHLHRNKQHGRNVARSLEPVTGAASIASNATITSHATIVRVEAVSVPVLGGTKSDLSSMPLSKFADSCCTTDSLRKAKRPQ